MHFLDGVQLMFGTVVSCVQFVTLPLFIFLLVFLCNNYISTCCWVWCSDWVDKAAGSSNTLLILEVSHLLLSDLQKFRGSLCLRESVNWLGQIGEVKPRPDAKCRRLMPTSCSVRFHYPWMSWLTADFREPVVWTRSCCCAVSTEHCGQH